jgi:putative transposase
MPTLPRMITLPDDSIFGHTYQMHNRDLLLKENNKKRLLLNCLKAYQPKTNEDIAAYAFCILEDRYFLAGGINGDHTKYSKWMQLAHSVFAVSFNRRHKTKGKHRSGAIGNSRPFTSPVEDSEALMCLLFALDYAPVDAGLVDKPEDWAWSSYRLYAHGKVNEYTEALTFPRWYLELGITMQERQKKYRTLGRKFYQSGRLKTIIGTLNANRPIGSEKYRMRQMKLRMGIRTNREKLAKMGDKALRGLILYAFSPSFRNAEIAAETIPVFIAELAREAVTHVLPDR